MLGDVAILQENNNQDFLRKIVTPAPNSVQAYDANKNPVTIPVENLPTLAATDYFTPFENVVMWLEIARARNRREMVRPRELQELERQLNFVSLG